MSSLNDNEAFSFPLHQLVKCGHLLPYVALQHHSCVQEVFEKTSEIIPDMGEYEKCLGHKTVENVEHITGKELFRGNAELDLFVYLVGHIRPLCPCPACAQASPQGHSFHPLGHFQQLQNIDVNSCKWKIKKQILRLCIRK